MLQGTNSKLGPSCIELKVIRLQIQNLSGFWKSETLLYFYPTKFCFSLTFFWQIYPLDKRNTLQKNIAKKT